MKSKSVLLLLTLTVLMAQPRPPRPAPRLNLLEACRGKITLAAFIVTTCAHCKAFAHDVMEPLFESQQVCVLAIAFDQGADTAHFAAEQHLRFPVYKISRASALDFLGLSGYDHALGTPQVVVIDRHGTIQAQSAALGSALLLQLRTMQDLIARLR